jgi:hypothetical protein
MTSLLMSYRFRIRFNEIHQYECATGSVETVMHVTPIVRERERERERERRDTQHPRSMATHTNAKPVVGGDDVDVEALDGGKKKINDSVFATRSIYKQAGQNLTWYNIGMTLVRACKNQSRYFERK